MAKFDGQTIIDRAFDLNTGAAYALSSVGLVWARRPWRPWSALGGFGKAPADALRVRFRVYLNAARAPPSASAGPSARRPLRRCIPPGSLGRFPVPTPAGLTPAGSALTASRPGATF